MAKKSDDEAADPARAHTQSFRKSVLRILSDVAATSMVYSPNCEDVEREWQRECVEKMLTFLGESKPSDREIKRVFPGFRVDK